MQIASRDAVGATTRGCLRWRPGWSFSLTGTADRDRRRGWYCMLAQQRWLDGAPGIVIRDHCVVKRRGQGGSACTEKYK